MRSFSDLRYDGHLWKQLINVLFPDNLIRSMNRASYSSVEFEVTFKVKGYFMIYITIKENGHIYPHFREKAWSDLENYVISERDIEIMNSMLKMEGYDYQILKCGY